MYEHCAVGRLHGVAAPRGGLRGRPGRGVLRALGGLPADLVRRGPGHLSAAQGEHRPPSPGGAVAVSAGAGGDGCCGGRAAGVA